jgi:hypothetical protein
MDQKLFNESTLSNSLEQISTNSLILNEAMYILIELYALSMYFNFLSLWKDRTPIEVFSTWLNYLSQIL